MNKTQGIAANIKRANRMSKPERDQFEFLMVFPGRPSAEMAAGLLEEAGITTLIKAPSDTGLFGEISRSTLLEFELHVAASHLDEARAILAPLFS
jgi:hypothetical protein